MSGIFISYRREDSQGSTGRLYDHLARGIDPARLFIDVDNIPPGADFVKVLGERVGDCDALLAVIGSKWISVQDQSGERRLDDPDDFVRIEIEAALQRDVKVVPVLVDGAVMPRAKDLPDTLKGLTRRQAMEVAHNRFAGDAERVARAVRQILADEDAKRGTARVEARDGHRLMESSLPGETGKNTLPSAPPPQPAKAGPASDTNPVAVNRPRSAYPISRPVAVSIMAFASIDLIINVILRHAMGDGWTMYANEQREAFFNLVFLAIGVALFLRLRHLWTLLVAVVVCIWPAAYEVHIAFWVRASPFVPYNFPYDSKPPPYFRVASIYWMCAYSLDLLMHLYLAGAIGIFLARHRKRSFQRIEKGV